MTANSGKHGAWAAHPPDPSGRRAARELVAYFVGAFAIAWTGVLLAATRTGLPAAPGSAERLRFAAFLAMLAGPSLACAGLTLRSRGVAGLRDLLSRLAPHVEARWYAALLIAPLALVFTLAALSQASSAYLPPILSGAPPLPIATTALVVGLGAGFFEELGWTGFATPRLLSRRSWARAGLLLGIAWAAWHALPDFWARFADGPLWPLHMVEWLVALSAFRILMTWVYSRTGSLLLGMLLHASFTGSQMLLWPDAGATGELIWYGLFAASLWVVVGGYFFAELLRKIASGPRPRRRTVP